MTDMIMPRAPRISRFERGKTYSVDEIKNADGYHRESYLLMLVTMMLKLQENAEAYYEGMDYSRNPNELKRSATFGDKWDKVWTMRDGKKANIVCWIDADTGLIYKPNGVSAPYPKPRADIFEPESYEYADPHGGWLYKNFDAEKKSMRKAKLNSNKKRSLKEVLEEGEAKMSGR